MRASLGPPTDRPTDQQPLRSDDAAAAACEKRLLTRRVVASHTPRRSEDTPHKRSEDTLLLGVCDSDFSEDSDTPLRGVREAKTCRCVLLPRFFAVGGLPRHPRCERPVRTLGYAYASGSEQTLRSMLFHHGKCSYSVYRLGGLRQMACSMPRVSGVDGAPRHIAPSYISLALRRAMHAPRLVASSLAVTSQRLLVGRSVGAKCLLEGGAHFGLPQCVTLRSIVNWTAKAQGRQCPMTPLITVAPATRTVRGIRSPPGSQLERNRAFWRMISASFMQVSDAPHPHRRNRRRSASVTRSSATPPRRASSSSSSDTADAGAAADGDYELEERSAGNTPRRRSATGSRAISPAAPRKHTPRKSKSPASPSSSRAFKQGDSDDSSGELSSARCLSDSNREQLATPLNGSAPTCSTVRRACAEDDPRRKRLEARRGLILLPIKCSCSAHAYNRGSSRGWTPDKFAGNRGSTPTPTPDFKLPGIGGSTPTPTPDLPVLIGGPPPPPVQIGGSVPCFRVWALFTI
jgi:hypothetical protein